MNDFLISNYINAWQFNLFVVSATFKLFQEKRAPTYSLSPYYSTKNKNKVLFSTIIQNKNVGREKFNKIILWLKYYFFTYLIYFIILFVKISLKKYKMENKYPKHNRKIQNMKLMCKIKFQNQLCERAKRVCFVPGCFCDCAKNILCKRYRCSALVTTI